MSEDFTATETFHRASKSSIIERFVIDGLYGYRKISIETDYAASVIIARNGSGKTTLLATLYAFLRCQFGRLRDLEFTTIRCKLRGIDEEIIITKPDIDAVFEHGLNDDIIRASRKFEIPPNELLNFLEREFSEEDSIFEDLHEDRIFYKIYSSLGHSTKEATEYCKRLRTSYFSHSPQLAYARAKISEALQDVGLLYLPTYRRIELSLNDTEAERRPYRRRKSFLRFSDNSLHPGNVQFGLGDVSERLSQLNHRLLTASNVHYREISANIINELIDGTFERIEDDQKIIPDPDELNLFFARVKGSPRGIRAYSDVAIPNIDKIYSGEGISVASNRFLRYFLSKLNAAIKATRDIELKVEEFITVCNKYLLSSDPTTDIGSNVLKTSSDSKLLKLNRLDLSVHVESAILKRKIELNSLSSGEKQMISLFGSLYLYDKQKIILIDEPELSLSMGWQRQILVDFINAPTCSQVIAITHSPFVFDNELEPFAKSMKVDVDFSRLPPADGEEEGDLD